MTVELSDEDLTNLFQAALAAPTEFRGGLATKLFPRWLIYTRQYKLQQHKVHWIENLFAADVCIQRLYTDTIKDIVRVNDGLIIRHEYSRALPDWLGCPLLRALAVTTGKAPNGTYTVGGGA